MRTLLKNAFDQVFAGYDAILAPVAPTTAYRIGEKTKDPLEMYLADGATLIIRKNIRAGQSLNFDGTLIVLGDVNAGAELTATGHILILGTMRGIAHAGSHGNSSAIVYATKLLPIQLRIADFIARAPDDEITDTSGPEMARIIENRVVIESCQFN